MGKIKSKVAKVFSGKKERNLKVPEPEFQSNNNNPGKQD